MMKFQISLTALIAFIAVSSLPMSAAITVVRDYRLGDADPRAVVEL